jgi:hypothetical protein
MTNKPETQNYSHMKKILTFLFTTTMVVSAMGQSATLKLNLEKNKTYRLKSVSSQNISQTVNGMEQSTTTSSNSVLSIKMMDATPAFIVAEVRFDTIINNTNAMGKNIVINSASEGNMASKESGDVMSAVMNRISKNPFYVKMEPTGKVIEIVNLAMIQSMVLKDTSLLDASLAPMLKGQVKNSVDNNTLKVMIEAFTYSLPAKEVKKGEAWTMSVPVNSGGMSLDIASSSTLNDVKDKVAMVASEITIKPAANAQPMVYGGAKINYDNLSGIGKSEAKINTQTGLILENVSKMNIVGDLNVEAPGMTMKIPMKINSQTTTTSI